MSPGAANAAPPPIEGEYHLRFASNQSAYEWEQLGRQAGGNLLRAFDAIRAIPRSHDPPRSVITA